MTSASSVGQFCIIRIHE